MLNWKIVRINSVSRRLKKEILRLWQLDPFASPFVSPSYLELMVDMLAQKGERAVFGMGYDEAGSLAALWPMRLDKKKNLQFLQYLYCDYATCAYRDGTRVGDLALGLSLMLKKLSPMGVNLNYIPEWGLTLEALALGLKMAGFRYHSFVCGKAPILNGRLGPDGIKKIKRQLGKNRSLKNYTNRLKRERGFFFETDLGGKNIDQWAEAFCSAHTKRWRGTLTPSKYEKVRPRDELKAVMKAWAEDSVLVRFSIHVASRRITFVTGLKAGNTLIYFHTTRLPVYSRLGIGNITIRLIGFWMLDNGYDTLDFGFGDEGYKYYFANKTRDVWRVYGGKSVFSPCFLRGTVEKNIRAKPKRLALWRQAKTLWRVFRHFGVK